MRATKAVIWDEIGAQHRFAVEAVDRSFRDICDDDRPFAGKTVMFSGDFNQTLPIVPKGSREDIVNATIQKSPLWESIEVLYLHQNMRVERGNADAHEFAQWLLAVGRGENMNANNEVRFPEYMRVHDINTLIDSIYPGINFANHPPEPEYFMNRMILAPRNIDVDGINRSILDKIVGDIGLYISADQMIHEAGADPNDDDPIPIEFLRSITASGLPPGELYLKVGCPIILLRNLSPSQGLCNGTRMIVTQMRERVLEVRLLGGKYNGEHAFIPRISLTPSNVTAFSFRFRRRQFPVRLAFALSINKSQGQSVQHVGLYLSCPVFAHGQLYVALSRATASHNIKILLPENQVESLACNVVYPEVLL